MKKVTITFPSVNSEALENNNDTIRAAFESLSVPDMLGHIGKTFRLIQNGDIWFMHDYATEDKLGFNMIFILDSEDALAEFNENSLPGWTAMGGNDPVVEDMTFEEFATFASENEETTFNPYDEFNLQIV